DLHPLQAEFVACGAIQCGYCTPAQLLAAKRLLDTHPNPSEAEVREAMAGVLCRCTGYLKPVQAVLRAAARLRGEEPPPFDLVVLDALDGGEWPTGGGSEDGRGGIDPHDSPAPGGTSTQTQTRILPASVAHPQTAVVNKPERKVDAVKLSKGRAV